MSVQPCVLIAEDDEDLCAMLRYNLEHIGFEVIEAHDGRSALEALTARLPSVIVLDWMLPSMSGIDVCRTVRCTPRTRDIPIVMVTAKDREEDKIQGFRTGADDYVTKPFSMPEILERIKALARRAKVQARVDPICLGDVTISKSAYKVTRAGRPIHLGPSEFQILRFLMENPHQVFSRDELLDTLWSEDVTVEPRTIDVHILRLRKAINGPGETNVIRTVRGRGYGFQASLETVG